MPEQNNDEFERVTIGRVATSQNTEIEVCWTRRLRFHRDPTRWRVALQAWYVGEDGTVVPCRGGSGVSFRGGDLDRIIELLQRAQAELIPTPNGRRLERGALTPGRP